MDSSIFNARANNFGFLPGPVFAYITLADELNGTNPRTKTALVEVMAEGQVARDDGKSGHRCSRARVAGPGLVR